MNAKLVLACVVASMAGCGTTAVRTTPPRPSAAPPTPPPIESAQPVTLDVLNALSLFAVGDPLDDQRARSLSEHIGTSRPLLGAFIDELLTDPRFAKRMAPRVLLNEDDRKFKLFDMLETLTRTTVGGRTFYHLRKPCTRAHTVSVHPWWALDTTVLVCSDSYQPEHFANAPTGSYCGGIRMAPFMGSDYCGCGRNLMWCSPDQALTDRMNQQLVDEVHDTIAQLVGDDKPLSTVFTTQATVRSGLADFLYNRSRFIAHEITELPDWRAWRGDGHFEPRVDESEGQHAGVLTTPVLSFMTESQRDRLRMFYDKVWCSTGKSTGVTADAMLKLGTVNLRDGDGWKQLAAMPVCTDCHARLDYGMQFFLGYPRGFDAIDFIPSLQKPGKGALYGRNIEDPRGEAPLNPHGFVELATAQPEFAACMSRDVLTHVFPDGAEVDDRQAIRQAYDRTHSLRAMMKVALVRYAEHSDRTLETPVVRAVDTPLVPVSPVLRALISEHCESCHSMGARSFEAAQLPRKTLENMLSQVAFGGMPKTEVGLPRASRRQLVRVLADTLWTGAERDTALAYFADAGRALPLHRPDFVLHDNIARAGGQPDDTTRLADREIRPEVVQMTPGFAAIQMAAVVKACKASGHEGVKLGNCIEHASPLEDAVDLGPLRSAPRSMPPHEHP